MIVGPSTAARNPPSDPLRELIEIVRDLESRVPLVQVTRSECRSSILIPNNHEA